jgi:hypothetical protein
MFTSALCGKKNYSKVQEVYLSAGNAKAVDF